MADDTQQSASGSGKLDGAKPTSGSVSGVDDKKISLPGSDGERAEKLLESSQRLGTETLSRLAEGAVKRLLESGKSQAAKSLFNADEKAELADALAQTVGTANLLGRSRVRLRLKQAEKHDKEHFTEDAVDIFTKTPRLLFSEQPTDFACFDEPDSQPKPMEPEKAVSWFQRLIPGLMSNTNAPLFIRAIRKLSFDLAATTDEELLGRVQDVIAKRLETGEGISTAPKQIDYILQQAGVSPNNPQYGEMVFRTNMKQAYNVGFDQERQDPDVIDAFPVWKYSGIRDGRQRKLHEVHFGRYYPASATFEEVRDSAYGGEFSGFNCRCDQIPIYKSEWRKLQAGGAKVSRFAETTSESGPSLFPGKMPWLMHVMPDVRQPNHYSCGASATMAVGKLFGVGPDTIGEWEDDLGTTLERSTDPKRIVAYLRELGLSAEPRQNMTLDDLARETAAGHPVIVCVQDYGERREPGASFAYGHYLTVLGVALGMVFCQDSSLENVEREPGGDVPPSEADPSGNISEPGRVMIDEDKFVDVWKDEGADGTRYVRFGIAVSRQAV